MGLFVRKDRFHFSLPLMELTEAECEVDAIGGEVPNREEENPDDEDEQCEEIDRRQAGNAGPGDPGITQHQQHAQDTDEYGDLFTATNHRLEVQGVGIRIGLLNEGFPFDLHPVHADGDCQNGAAEGQGNQEVEDGILKDIDRSECQGGHSGEQHFGLPFQPG